MVRLLALLDKLDLDQGRRTGGRARSGLEAVARENREILKNVRGAGVMLGFDVQRADLCDALLDRAFRRGLVLLKAGERSVRLYPRYDTEPSAIDEALAILRLAVEDLVGGRAAGDVAPAVKVRVGTLAIALDTHDEEGVSSDPRFGENDAFYLQALAILPTVQNEVELEQHLLDALRDRLVAAGYLFLSTLIEERILDTGPEWLRRGAVLQK